MQPPRRAGRPRGSRSRSGSTGASRRSNRRRVGESSAGDSTPASIDSSLPSGGSAATLTSIRDSARVRSIATGRQLNAHSRGSAYNVAYHQFRSTQSTEATSQSHPTTQSIDATSQSQLTAPTSPVQDRDAIVDGTLPLEDLQAPASPIQNMMDLATSDRTCICLDKIYPKDCTACKAHYNQACNQHTIIKCSTEGCDKKFHKSCICSLQRINPDNNEAINAYSCLECTSTEQALIDEEDIPFAALDHGGKLRRVGILASVERHQNSTRDEKNMINSIIRDMKKCMSPEDVQQILDSDPRPYPTAVKMNPAAIEKHVVQGRRSEISLLLYDVHKCDCCGRVQPGHSDSNFINKDRPPPFKRKHLMNMHRKAWHCKCWGFCKGSQFYSPKKPTHMDEYRRNHHGQDPSTFLDLEEENAWLCNNCYSHEFKADQIQRGGKLPDIH